MDQELYEPTFTKETGIGRDRMKLDSSDLAKPIVCFFNKSSINSPCPSDLLIVI